MSNLAGLVTPQLVSDVAYQHQRQQKLLATINLDRVLDSKGHGASIEPHKFGLSKPSRSIEPSHSTSGLG